MSSYDSMKQKLLPLRIYSLAEGAETDCELKAYAEGLDSLSAQLTHLLREGFVATAQDEGLSERERFIGNVREQLLVSSRRARLLGYETRRLHEGSLSGVEAFVRDCGVSDFEIEQNAAAARLAFTIRDTLDSAQKQLLEEQITGAVPPNLVLLFQYS